jgi:hypothetical protein
MDVKGEVATLNDVERQAEMLRHFLDRLASRPAGDVDGRWFAIARTELQQGFMALRRAVTKDAGF